MNPLDIVVLKDSSSSIEESETVAMDNAIESILNG